MEEKYIPSTKEIKKAKDMLTEEQKEMSSIRETAEMLKEMSPVLCKDPVKLEESFNDFEKSIQELEGKDDLDNKAARDILIQGRNLLAYLLGKEIKQRELKKELPK